MRQVGYEDSRTTLEVYAHVQQWLAAKQIHQGFDDLLATAGEAADVPTDGRGKMSRSTIVSSPHGAEIGDDAGSEVPNGPRKVVDKRKLVELHHAARQAWSAKRGPLDQVNEAIADVEAGRVAAPIVLEP
jgi:hypothetical protein